MKKVFFAVVILILLFLVLLRFRQGEHLGAGKLDKIPSSAEIVYHFEGYIYTMDSKGENVTQITFEKSKGRFEHVAVSYDHNYIVANEHYDKNRRDRSRMWLYDLRAGTKTLFAPDFFEAGNGGVAWGPDGFIYFSGMKEENKDPRLTRPYKMKYDGTGLLELTQINGVDVGVSDDGKIVTFIHAVIEGSPKEQPFNTEVWAVNSDGTSSRRIYAGGEVGVASVHDGEITFNNKQVVFSKVNPEFKNFPNNPATNTAHDLWVINLDGTGLRRLTKPGPISIIPNLKNDSVVYFEASEKDNYIGAAVVSLEGGEQVPKRIRPGANSPKWIPKR